MVVGAHKAKPRDGFRIATRMTDAPDRGNPSATVDETQTKPNQNQRRDNQKQAARKKKPPKPVKRGARDKANTKPRKKKPAKKAPKAKSLWQRVRPWTAPVLFLTALGVVFGGVSAYYDRAGYQADQSTQNSTERAIKAKASTLSFGAFGDYTITRDTFSAPAVFLNRTDGTMREASGMVSFCTKKPEEEPCSLDEVIHFTKGASVTTVAPGGRMIVGRDPSNPETDFRRVWRPSLYDKIVAGERQLFLYAGAKYLNPFGQRCRTVACLRWEPSTGKLHYCPWPEHNDEQCEDEESS